MAKTMTGSRAIVSVDNQIVGLFDSIDYGENVGMEAIHILGRFSASELAETSYEAITVNCSGFRIIENGVHVLPKFPKLQDILNLGEITLTVSDRQTGEVIATIVGCKPANNRQSHAARSTSKINVTYMGLILSDEDGDSSESPGATDLP